MTLHIHTSWHCANTFPTSSVVRTFVIATVLFLISLKGVAYLELEELSGSGAFTPEPQHSEQAFVAKASELILRQPIGTRFSARRSGRSPEFTHGALNFQALSNENRGSVCTCITCHSLSLHSPLKLGTDLDALFATPFLYKTRLKVRNFFSSHPLTLLTTPLLQF